MLKNSKKTLLIVEDDLNIGQKLLDTTKSLSTFENIELAENIQDSLALLSEKNFDFMILDLNLPDGSGIEILKWLKEKELQVEVFIFSINTELKRLCLKNGASDFFDKSNDFDSLIARLESSELSLA